MLPQSITKQTLSPEVKQPTATLTCTPKLMFHLYSLLSLLVFDLGCLLYSIVIPMLSRTAMLPSMGDVLPCRAVKPCISHMKSNLICPNPFHPHVTATKQFLQWMTPFGLCEIEKRSHLLPEHLIKQECLLITHAVSTKSLSNYGAGLVLMVKNHHNHHLHRSWHSRLCQPPLRPQHLRSGA